MLDFFILLSGDRLSVENTNFGLENHEKDLTVSEKDVIKKCKVIFSIFVKAELMVQCSFILDNSSRFLQDSVDLLDV